ncbi:hypothetical protein LJR219_004166 [Phenylobacterium sp. LjRoot219]|uniref:hypothetical protein n=1 Tax=Phenylobacterium sp. LjRoot219 TaxID=3342283 RepID=UPI003ECE4B66
MRRTFGLPALIALSSAVGLGAALLGDGVWDILGAALLTAPLAVTAWRWLRRS